MLMTYIISCFESPRHTSFPINVFLSNQFDFLLALSWSLRHTSLTPDLLPCWYMADLQVSAANLLCSSIITYLSLVPLSLESTVKGFTIPAPARNTIDQDLTVVRRMKESCVSDGMRG